jgi:hypothetical protein
MRLDVIHRELVPSGLRAVKTLATLRGPLHPTQRAMIDLTQRIILGSQVDVDSLEPITPEETAVALPHQEARPR